MKNSKKTKPEQIAALEKAMKKFGDSDGTRKVKLEKLKAKN